MAFPWHNQPYSEEAQQNTYNGFPFLPEFGHRRSAPREDPFITWSREGPAGRGWYQGGCKLRNLKSKKYWARPVDGARKGAWGRIKDGLTGEGPDVFVVANGDRRTLMREMPHRNNWSNWDSTNMKWLYDNNSHAASGDMDWYQTAHLGTTKWAQRKPNEVYNFRTRRYSEINARNCRRFWSDAHWPKGQRKKHGLPACWREWNGYWNTTVPTNAGLWPGGRPLV